MIDPTAGRDFQTHQDPPGGARLVQLVVVIKCWKRVFRAIDLETSDFSGS